MNVCIILFYFEYTLPQVELKLPPLLFSVDLLLFKVFFQVKTNKKQKQRGSFCIIFNDLTMFLLSLADCE